MPTPQQLLEMIPEFVERTFPKNDTAANGGEPTSGRGEASVLLTRFVMYIQESPLEE